MQLSLLESTSLASPITSVSALDNENYPRHRWYFFKEAFSADLVNQALKEAECNKNDLVVDPFSGSGTVALSSVLNNIPAIGFEVNPFLAFVGRTKLSRCKPETLEYHVQDVRAGINCGARSHLEGFSTFTEVSSLDKWLFNTEVIKAYEGGFRATIGKNAAIRDLLRLCLINAAMDVCNAVKDGKCLRYRKTWKTDNYGKKEFLLAFETHFKLVLDDLRNHPLPQTAGQIHLGDSRALNANSIGERKFKLAVMSPPYLNSFDYTDVYRPELFLGRFVTTPEELVALRKRTLRSHVQVQWDNPIETDFGHNFTDSFVQINERIGQLWNRRIPSMIQAYFEDMKVILLNLRRLAKPDASVRIVVSTSAYAGVEIPVDLIIGDIGTQTGWFLREVKVLRHLRRVAGQQWAELANLPDKIGPHLRESVIILDANHKKKRRIV